MKLWLQLAKNLLALLTIIAVASAAETVIQKQRMGVCNISNFNWRNAWYHKAVELFKDLGIMIKEIGH